MPDLLVKGTLHTLDPGRPVAEAALMRDGRFARVGSREECEREARRVVEGLPAQPVGIHPPGRRLTGQEEIELVGVALLRGAMALASPG